MPNTPLFSDRLLAAAERTGVPRSVATKLSGHRTEAVYRRDVIVSDADLREASARLTGTITGTAGATAGKGRGIN
jgi:hypothetical protein